MTTMIDATKFLINTFEYCVKDKFGVITITASNVKRATVIPHLLFTIDTSISMQDDDKINYIVQFLHQVVDNTQLYLSLITFNETAHLILNDVFIKDNSNIKQLIVDALCTPSGGTNILTALECSYRQIDDIVNKGVRDVYHICMTDGYATEQYAENRANNLIQYIHPLATSHTFIGIGEDHDANLLSQLCSYNPQQLSYHFIKYIQEVDAVYKTVLHSIFYNIMTHATISTEGCTIYNSITGEWVSHLSIPAIHSQQTYYYNIRVGGPVRILLQGVIGYELQAMYEATCATEDALFLQMHIYRQQLMECICDIYKKSVTFTIDDTEEDKYYRQVVADLHQFIIDNHLEQDIFINNIYADFKQCITNTHTACHKNKYYASSPKTPFIGREPTPSPSSKDYLYGW